jgi:hypothetical protein
MMTPWYRWLDEGQEGTGGTVQTHRSEPQTVLPVIFRITSWSLTNAGLSASVILTVFLPSHVRHFIFSPEVDLMGWSFDGLDWTHAETPEGLEPHAYDWLGIDDIHAAHRVPNFLDGL